MSGRVEVSGEIDLPSLVGVVHHRLEHSDPSLAVPLGEHVLGGRALVVQRRREQRRVGRQRDQRPRDPERVPEVRREVGGDRHLVVGLDRRRHRTRSDGPRVERRVGCVDPHPTVVRRRVREEVVADRRREVRREHEAVAGLGVGEVLRGRLAHRRDGPQPVAHEPHPLAVRGRVVGRADGGLYLAANRREPVRAEWLRTRRQFRVVSTQLSLEADEAQQRLRDSSEYPRRVVDRVELVLEADVRPRVVERPDLELAFQPVGFRRGTRPELVGVDLRGVGDPASDLVHTPADVATGLNSLACGNNQLPRRVRWRGGRAPLGGPSTPQRRVALVRTPIRKRSPPRSTGDRVPVRSTTGDRRRARRRPVDPSPYPQHLCLEIPTSRQVVRDRMRVF